MFFAERVGLWCTGILPLVVLGALVVRRRWRRCWSFPLYLASVGCFNLTVALRGTDSFSWSTWLGAEIVQGALTLAVAVEITLRGFASLPRGLQTARAALLLCLGAACAVMWSGDGRAASTLPDLAREMVPRFELAAIFAFLALLVVALFYELPLDELHGAIACGLAAYAGLSAAGLQIVRDVGWAARMCVSGVLTSSYIALLSFWLAAAWRSEADVPAPVVRKLWPWRC